MSRLMLASGQRHVYYLSNISLWHHRHVFVVNPKRSFFFFYLNYELSTVFKRCALIKLTLATSDDCDIWVTENESGLTLVIILPKDWLNIFGQTWGIWMLDLGFLKRCQISWIWTWILFLALEATTTTDELTNTCNSAPAVVVVF